jgi:hypothetical protein
MSPFGILVMIMFVSAAVGAGMQLSIGMAFLSTETIYSPNLAKRYTYRFFIFGMCFFASFFLTFIFLFDEASAFIKNGATASARGLIYMALCLPVACLLFWLDCRLIVWGDKRIQAGRDALETKNTRRYPGKK